MAPQPLKGKRRVLVVDDCDDIRHVWHRVLAAAGYEVIEADDATEGIRKAQANDPDVVLMDLWMPGVDGFDAMHQLKENDSTAQLPVIALSGDLFAADRARAAGCDAFLVKPVRPIELLDTIDEVLASRGCTDGQSHSK